jgi:hypothetical protein
MYIIPIEKGYPSGSSTSTLWTRSLRLGLYGSLQCSTQNPRRISMGPAAHTSGTRETAGTSGFFVRAWPDSLRHRCSRHPDSLGPPAMNRGRRNSMTQFFHVFKDGKSVMGPMNSKIGACMECLQGDGESVVELDIHENTLQRLSRADCTKLVALALPSLGAP